MRKKMSFGKIINFAFYASALILILFIILALFGNKDKNGITPVPYSMFTVLTGSMSPTFDAGSVIITKKTGAEKLQPGDILTFRQFNGNTLITHRIVEVIYDGRDYSYITKGDANNVEDAMPVLYENTVGRVIFWINGVGTALLYIRTPYGIVFIVCIVLLLILVSYFFNKLKTYASEEK